jgi:hypothetical protein
VIDAVVTLAASRAALLATWAVGLGVFALWLVFEFRGMIFTDLLPLKPLILRGLRAGFLLCLLLPVALLILAGLAGAWGVLIIYMGAAYLPPSTYALCVSLGLFYSIRRDRRTLKSPYKGIAYAVAAALAALGTAMLYVSLVWLDKPV